MVTNFTTFSAADIAFNWEKQLMHPPQPRF